MYTVEKQRGRVLKVTVAKTAVSAASAHVAVAAWDRLLLAGDASGEAHGGGDTTARAVEVADEGRFDVLNANAALYGALLRADTGAVARRRLDHARYTDRLSVVQQPSTADAHAAEALRSLGASGFGVAELGDAMTVDALGSTAVRAATAAVDGVGALMQMHAVADASIGDITAAHAARPALAVHSATTAHVARATTCVRVRSANAVSAVTVRSTAEIFDALDFRRCCCDVCNKR